MLPIARLINPHAINMFDSPFRCIHGVIANGMPTLMAFRTKAMLVKESPVICREIESKQSLMGRIYLL